jgi:predicted nucleic acid-binding Zn ribbon protein
VRRQAPRPIATALGSLSERLVPPSTLARVQECWAEVAGPAVAEEAEPVSERGGVVTVACRSAVWAQELELMGEDLSQRLNTTLTGDAAIPGPVTGLRFTAARPGARRPR